MKRSIAAILILLLSTSCLFAEINYTDFLNKSSGARGMAMGSAYTALAEGPDSVFLNPAGLAFELWSIQFANSYASYFKEIEKTNFHILAPFMNGMAEISLVRSQVSDIPYVEEVAGRPNVAYYFTNEVSALVLSYAQKLDPLIGVGFNLKSYNHKLDQDSASALAVDVGLKYQSNEPSDSAPALGEIGLLVQNVFSTPMTWTTGQKDNFQTLYTLGIAKQIWTANAKLVGTIDMDVFEGKRPIMRYGLEYWLSKNALAVRAGLNNTNFTFGLGLKFAGLQMDYAYLTNDDLGNSHKASFIIAL
ncbi:MAG: PorV/PorQ family protein [Candidatus Margulisiibacteriota bacterium]|jgi:hypothetical protein